MEPRHLAPQLPHPPSAVLTPSIGGFGLNTHISTLGVPASLSQNESQRTSQRPQWVHRLANHISKTVLSTMHVGGPKWIVGGTVSAVRIAGIMGIEHRLLDISFLSDVAWYSALTNPDRFQVPSGRSGEEIGHGVPITYVPMRNTIFLSLSAAYLESRVLYAIEVEGIDVSDVAASVYMAPSALDYSGYPDCRPEFYENMRRTLELGSKLWAEYAVPIKV